MFSIRITRLAKIRTTPCGDDHLESLRKGTWNLELGTAGKSLCW